MKPWMVVTIAALAGSLVGGFIFRPVSPLREPIPTVLIDLPAQLIIPAINVAADVEPVALDSQNNMGVPQNVSNVGWYSLGVRPGEVGQAVMDGHFDTPELTPSVFWNLKDLQPGDMIAVRGQNGQTLSFRVRRVSLEDTGNFPIQEIFGPSSRPQLNLITCDGVYDQNLHAYNQRVVVFSDLVSS